MKSASTQNGGQPAAPRAESRPGESQPRLAAVRLPEPRSRDRAPTPADAHERARPASERRPVRDSDEPRTGVVRRVEASGWRCLEWKAPAKRQRRRRAEANTTKVTIVQLSADGELLRQNGPDTWLPEAGDFMQRMSSLLARSLGFAQCRSVCLRNERAVIAVSPVGSKVVAVSGPARSMANVLRRVGLQ